MRRSSTGDGGRGGGRDEPNMGVEPMTFRLLSECFTNLANLAIGVGEKVKRTPATEPRRGREINIKAQQKIDKASERDTHQHRTEEEEKAGGQTGKPPVLGVHRADIPGESCVWIWQLSRIVPSRSLHLEACLAMRGSDVATVSPIYPAATRL